MTYLPPEAPPAPFAWFTPPSLEEVPTYGTREENPLASRLMRFFATPRARGACVWLMSDGTHRVNRSMKGLLPTAGYPTFGKSTVLINQEPYPAVPLPEQVNGAIDTTWYLSEIASETVQEPYVVTVYYGGHMNDIADVAEYEALVAIGMEEYITFPPAPV